MEERRFSATLENLVESGLLALRDRLPHPQVIPIRNKFFPAKKAQLTAELNPYRCTTNTFLLLTDPDAVVTRIRPDVAPLGTVAVMCVSE